MSIRDDVEVYAVPGNRGIIDTINHATGLTRIYGETAEQVATRHPGAVRMTWAAWTADEAARQHTPIEWIPTTHDRYHEMLNVLPPELWIGGGFLVGEPMDHDVTNGQPRYSAYWHRGGEYVKASRPLTRAEFRAEVAR